MNILTYISTLPEEIQTHIFYYTQSPLAVIFNQYKKIIISNNYILRNNTLDYDQWMIDHKCSTIYRPKQQFTHYRDIVYNEFKSSRMQDRFRIKGHNKIISRKCKRMFVEPRDTMIG